MNKVVELLEQHCQWIAIGVGGIFLAWVVWAYVLVSPVAVEVPGEPALTPGNVDDRVKQIAQRVQEQMDSKQVVKAPDRGQDDPLERFLPTWRGDPASLPDIAGHLPSNSVPFTPDLRDKDELPPAPDLVAELPSVPPAEVLPNTGLKTAIAQVVVGPIGGQPGQPVQPVQPVAPGAAPVLPANATDTNYVRGEFRIEPREIADAWEKMKVPPGLQTLIIDVKVMRQEKKPDGTWSEPVEVKRLDNGIKHWPIPERKDGFQAIGQFEAWFAGPQGQADLLRPPFYQLLAGEGPWDPPTNLDDVKLQVKAINDADRLKRAEENRAQRENRVRNRPQPEDPGDMGTPRRGGRRGEPEFKVEDTNRPNSLADLAGLQLAQVDPRRFPGGRPPMNPDEMGAFPEEMGGGQDWQQPGQPVQPGIGQPQMPALPAGQFDPRQSPSIFGWFFDTNVQEGHTYRYQVLYAIKNPMWQNNQVAKPALAQVYSLWSKLDENAWSEERTVETTTKFFIADRSWTGGSVPNSVRIEIFKWTGGKWQSRVFSVAAGDQIGWDEVGTDWGTHSRLVDVRFDDRLEKAYLLVMGPDGRIVERDPLSDRIDNNEDRQALKFLVQQAQLPVGANAGGGVPPLAGR